MKLTSDEHFTVDGTLIEAWASLKSFRPKGEQPSDRTPPDDPGNPSVDFHGERRQNATHQSTTDPEARLAKKGAGKEARLCYTESVLMENRNGIMIDLRVGQAGGRAECEQGLEMLQEVRGSRRITVAGDKGYDTAAFVASCRALNVTPHVAQNERRPGGSALDQRTTSWPGYAVSQRVRKRVEEIFGWIKTVGNFRRTRYRGVERTSFRRLPGRRRLQPAEDRKALSQRMNRVASEPHLATVSFKLLYGLVILHHARRRLARIAVTSNPTAEWIAGQVTEAFPWSEAPRHLIRDRDRAFGSAYSRRVHADGYTRSSNCGTLALAERTRRASSSARSGANASTTSWCSAKRICVVSSKSTLATTTRSEPTCR